MDDELKLEFLRALARYRKLGSALPEACGFQLAEMSVMQRVATGYEEEGCCLNVAEIQQTLSISKSGVSQTLSVLERKGYIVRQIDKQDRRRIAVVATPQGRQELQQAIGAYDRMLEQLAEEYGEADMRALTALLARLAEAYDRVQKKQCGGQ